MITIRNLNKIHNQGRGNEFQSLHDIDLEVAAGQLVVLQGVSGSGKTTLLSILGALIKPTSGEVIVDGRRVAKLPDLHASRFRSHNLGFVFQHFNLFETLDVARNVSVPLIPQGLGQGEVDRRVAAAMELAGIEHKARQRVADLSGGEKQRCAIARALVTKPRVVLCDEPTANLDRENTLRFIAILRRLKERETTVVVATHDPVFADLDVVDQVVAMRGGRIVAP
ncbi:ABC transporter ATP-binding protein [bacterium DOLZORAL124_64_63]|nr:MAG: ABC transporter ATP-binding protein [bacterium DOLZORAL124_64_63]